MAKYKNISNMRIMVSDGSKLTTIKPQQIIELTVVPYDCLRFLQEIQDVKPQTPTPIRPKKSKKS